MPKSVRCPEMPQGHILPVWQICVAILCLLCIMPNLQPLKVLTQFLYSTSMLSQGQSSRRELDIAREALGDKFCVGFTFKGADSSAGVYLVKFTRE